MTEKEQRLIKLQEDFKNEKDVFKKMEIQDEINELKGKIITCNFQKTDCETCSG